MTQVEYIYHSCFLVSDERCQVVFDYWRDPEGRLRQRLGEGGRRVYFVVSHFHPDHFNPEILSLPHVRLLLSYDAVKRRKVDRGLLAAVLRPGEGYADELISLQCFRSTDIGVSVALTMPDGTRCFHAGDLNNWFFAEEDCGHLKVLPEQMEKLFLSVVRDVGAVFPSFDHLMFPVDPRLGRQTFRGLRQWLRAIPAQHIHPMHCWDEDYRATVVAELPLLLASDV